jgi:type VI secretion system secreted protein Hcp
MKGRTRCGALVLACAFLLALPSAASARLFLELDGIQGESTVVGFENQIELGSFQFGVAKQKDKPASFSNITVTKELDRATPTLMLRTANGAAIPSAKVRFTRTSENGQIVYLRYCFTGVRITSFSQSSGGDSPDESVSFSYGTIVQSYTQQDAGGGQGTVFSSGWDLIGNLQFGGACDN